MMRLKRHPTAIVSVDTTSAGTSIAEPARRLRFVTPTVEAATEAIGNDEISQLWKPRLGDNELVILPTTEEMNATGNLPWLESVAHYCGGKDVMNALGISRPESFPMAHGCRKFYLKQPCLWCNKAQEFGKSSSKVDRDLGKALRSSRSIYVNLVDLRNPKLVRQARLPNSIKATLLLSLQDGDLFCDPKNLLVIRIKKTSTGPNPMNVDYAVRVAKQSVGAIQDHWIDGIDDLRKFIPAVPSIDEVQDCISTITATTSSGSYDVGLDADDLDEYTEYAEYTDYNN